MRIIVPVVVQMDILESIVKHSTLVQLVSMDKYVKMVEHQQVKDQLQIVDALVYPIILELIVKLLILVLLDLMDKPVFMELLVEL
jgi:hypothetical protein